jgi:hypothetical protein
MNFYMTGHETGSWRGVLDTTLCDNVHWSYIVLDMVMCTYAVLIVLDMVMCTYHAVLIVLRHGDVYISSMSSTMSTSYVHITMSSTMSTT